MFAQGVSPRVVMEILGHSQISVTMNTYSHGGVDLQYSVETDVFNEVWMVMIARNLVRSLCR